MELIDQKHLDRLQDSGLFVSHPLAAFGGGVWVVKPTTTKGHYIPEYSAGYIAIGDEPVPPDTNAPMTAFYRQNSAWVVNIKPTTGRKMEPDEFFHEWESPEEAIEDILDFYFGNPSRMLAYTGIIPRTDLNCHLPLYLPNSQSISHPGSIKSDTPSGTFTGPNSSYSSPA